MVISSLIEDIQRVLAEGVEISDEQAEEFAKSLASTLQEKLHPDSRVKSATLRMSNVGKPPRQLWYDINMPEKAEKFHPNVYMKFLMGDIIEEVIILLTKLAGHEVTGAQDELEIEGIKGHRDAVIDGTTVDIKSASEYSFKKFVAGLKPEEDSFGYLQQIQNYVFAGQSDELVVDKDRGAFLAMNKVTGAMTLDFHDKSIVPVDEIIKHKKEMVASEEPPERCFEDIPQSETSPNRKLGPICSMCAYKQECWPNLRTFIYKTYKGPTPTFFTHIEKEPNVPEIKDET